MKATIEAATPAGDRMAPIGGRRRAVVESVTPELDGGRFPIKRVVGESVTVAADAFADGHDVVRVALRHRPPGEESWLEVPMHAIGNERWTAAFDTSVVGRHAYAVVAWTDAWATWRRDLRARLQAGQDVTIDLRIGAALIESAAERASADDAALLRDWAGRVADAEAHADPSAAALDERLDALMAANADRTNEAASRTLEVVVDPVLARFSSWYELFPRSASSDPDRPGTLRDVIDRLDYVARLGFDVLYLPPIHPIGLTFRKGPNNVTEARDEDPGVPWAIGSPDGGHAAIHPELGTEEDLRDLVDAASARGLSIALDIAFQASPDHPAVAEHPTWFRQRPDGSIQYAENPPKKYQDIYPFDFESSDWERLWGHLLGVVERWIDAGIRIFRVDNPHTKPFPFWEWLIEAVKRDHPDVLFLSEAFTRPKVMFRLAKLGFSQSYTYFTWRNTKAELTEYFGELVGPPLTEFFRPNAWPNTPDILHETLQHGGRAAFEARLVLAATLSSNYGIYGPAYELMEHTPIRPGSEEYRDSEKYQVRHWDLDRPDSLAPLIERVNRIRHDHPALQSNAGLAFESIDDDELLAYTKVDPGTGDIVLVVVSLDFERPRSGTLELDLARLGIEPDAPYEVEDLVDGSVRLWNGPSQPIEIEADELPARIFHLRPDVRTEAEFEHFLG